MGRICGHCKEVFLPKRKNVMYCSSSCRQMAYMQRKFVPPVAINNLQEIELQNKPNEKPSIDSLDNQTNEPSIDVLEENKKVSIDVLKNVNQTDIPLTNTIINETQDFITIVDYDYNIKINNNSHYFAWIELRWSTTLFGSLNY